MNKLYGVPNISQLVKQQMGIHQSTAYLSSYLKNSRILANNYSQIIKNSMVVSKHINEMYKVASNPAVSAYIKKASESTFSSAKLADAIKPLLSSRDFKLMSTANSIKNKIEKNPAAAYSSFQKALNQQSAPRLKQLDKDVRNQIEQIKHENDERYNRSDPDDRKMDTEATIKELQNPGNVDKTRDKDVKFSIEYFVLIFQLLTLILYSSGYIANDKTFTELTYVLNLINTSIELYYKEPK